MKENLGVRGNVPSFSQIFDESASKKNVLVELRLSTEATGWSIDQGTTYQTALPPLEYDNLRRDVVGVRSIVTPSLTRQETLALCRSTASSYYYDPDTEDSGTRWDDGVTQFDQGDLWDQVAFLYINLSDGSNPQNTTVVAEWGFYFSSSGCVMAELGDDKLGDGSFEGSWS